LEGDDIPAPKALLARVKEEEASRVPDALPYSLATNLAHAVFWQRIWLNRLKGLRAESFLKDWRVPAVGEFAALRREFLDGLQEALSIASAKQIRHSMKSDKAAEATLINIAVHDAYHLGQINLIKRALRKTRS
jgi:uncharacterized damage-inducible protein DinB